MSGFAVKEHYYSGQGVVMIGTRDVNGKAKGLKPLGNVSALALAVATTVVNHKESTTGIRGDDLRLQTGTACTASITMENFRADNLALVLRGDNTFVPGAAVVAQAAQGYAGSVIGVGKVGLTALAPKKASTPLVAYVADGTPWDFKPNLDAGSFLLNDGSLSNWSVYGDAITAVTVGATTSLAVTGSPAAVGDTVVPQGFSGADAAVINGKPFTVVSNSGTAVVINAVTTGKTITATGTPKLGGSQVLAVDYTYGDQYLVDALTEAAIDYYLRFEGVNTVEGNAPVVVEVFRFSSDPLKALDLISDTVGQFVLEGSVLADVLQPTGSKYFKVMKQV